MRLLSSTLFFAAGVAALSAAPCGTVAAPETCELDVDNVRYTFSNFELVAGDFAAADFGIDLATGGGGTAFITFAKTVAGSFAANAGQTKNFTITYDVQLTALAAGTVQFEAPGIVSIGPASTLENGFAAVQMILVNTPDSESCQAILNGNGKTQGVCDLPPGTSDFLSVGNLGALTGGTGNVSFGSFSNLLDATFTPDEVDPGGRVPEPSTWAMLAGGLGLLGWRRRTARG